MNRLYALLPALALTLSATACASWKPTPTVEVVVVKFDEDLLQCEAAPAVPPHGATLADWQVYVVKLWAAGQDCRAKLGAILQYQRQTTPAPTGKPT